MPTHQFLRTPTQGAVFRFCRAMFVFGIVFLLLGNFISFAPGTEQGFFILTATFLAFGLASASRVQVYAALVLLVLACYAVYLGHMRGVAHQAWLRQNPSPLLHQP